MINDELLHKWVNGELTGEELAAFKRRPEYPSLAKLYRQTEHLAVPDMDAQNILANILKKEKEENAGRRIFLTTWLKYAAAACLLILAGWFVWTNTNSETHYQMAKGEKTNGLLPDGSQFFLNAESHLWYNKITWNKERSLHLTGEAFFEVVKGSTFTVHTPAGSVQVLGTKFNVRSRNGILDVKCQHGKVAVLTPDGKTIDQLSQYDAIRIEPGKIPEKYRIAPAGKAAWVEGITKLRKVTLAEALQEIERQYNVDIHTEGIDTSEIMSCNFQHDDLALALQTTLSSFDIVFEIKNNGQVYLRKK
ncbi:MAG TPA: DUF4974 domain-containing protein [Bacteroidetes bacterium]|nr:DUF4974 domain-containing protein [Bacteroidota bacterium]